MPEYKTPISTLVLIYSADLEILLLERADKVGFWQSVTGSQEANETLQQTAAREVLEETGIDTNQFDLEDWQASNVYEIYAHWRHRYAPNVTQNREHLFGLCVPRDIQIRLAPKEHLRYKWVSLREAATGVFSWTNVDAIRRLAEKHQFAL